ncbi:hypothetical protein AVEN_78886-1 [Araneus ventricosus]|uniref:Uncharacterized protein n=1 Tax=Araneus ventricosus TaxID=182803 RepID=A0A4Y2G3Q8_ARAVE|nr:hypothetical protein AVEN_78886-1 [Araneus ventricosus]
MTRTTPELAPPLQTFAPYQRKDVWPRRIQGASDPLTRRFFSGIRFRTWNPPGPRSRSCHRGLESVLRTDEFNFTLQSCCPMEASDFGCYPANASHWTRLCQVFRLVPAA